MKKLHMKKAIHACQQGGIIAYPTEAVFGLGCIPFFEHSVQRILKLKKRSIRKGLILVAADVRQLDEYVDFSKLRNSKMVFDSWPGPVTWLIPAKETTPHWLIGSHNTLAVRVSSDQIIRALCNKLGPILSTSANPSGSSPAKSYHRVRHYFMGKIDYIMPHSITNRANPTEIRDAQTGKTLRQS